MNSVKLNESAFHNDAASSNLNNPTNRGGINRYRAKIDEMKQYLKQLDAKKYTPIKPQKDSLKLTNRSNTKSRDAGSSFERINQVQQQQTYVTRNIG